MKQKTIKMINGGFAIYVGIGSLITAIGGLVGLAIWLYEVITEESEFKWLGFTLLISITTITGLIAYVLLRVAKEEFDA